jgi:hypothetical protein
MHKIIIGIIIITSLQLDAHAEQVASQQTPDVAQSKPEKKAKYRFTGIVNGLIGIRDEGDPGNMLYVENNTLLDNGCIATFDGIICSLVQPVFQNKTQNKNTANKYCIPIKEMFSHLQAENMKQFNFPVIGNVGVFVAEEFEALFSTKEKIKMIAEIFDGYVLEQHFAEKNSVIILKKNTLKLLGGM